MKNNEMVVKHIIDTLGGNSAWIEIGSVSKGGSFKVYVDPNDMVTSKAKIDNMFELKEYANKKLEAEKLANKVF